MAAEGESTLDPRLERLMAIVTGTVHVQSTMFAMLIRAGVLNAAEVRAELVANRNEARKADEPAVAVPFDWVVRTLDRIHPLDTREILTVIEGGVADEDEPDDG